MQGIKKKDIYLGFLVVAIIVGMMYAYNRDQKRYEKEIRELSVRLAQAEEHPDTFYIHDSIPVYRDKVVEVDKTDYKKLLADKELIKELGLKVSQLESENRTLLNTRDTVVLEPESDSVLSYRDKWVTFKYLMDERVLGYSVRDSLSAYVSREYKHKFLWWRWGTKGYNVSIVSHNPKCKVEYNKYIIIK
jgi:preprotein translocase subunit YajC